MRIHLNQIPEGGTAYFEEDLDPSFLELDGENESADSPVRCALDVGVSGSGLFATGQVDVTLRLRCVACLEIFDFPLSLTNFALQIELEGRESVDLTPYIREDILLVLPSHPRCDASGTRNCPATFRSAPDHSFPPTAGDGSSAWNVLDQLKKKP